MSKDGGIKRWRVASSWLAIRTTIILRRIILGGMHFGDNGDLRRSHLAMTA
jgi:hypothetical protein